MHRSRFVGVLVVVALCASVGTFGQTAFTHQALAIGGGTAVGLATATKQPSAKEIMTWCSGALEDGPIRYMYHGGTPTAATGEPLLVGQRIEILGVKNIDRFRGIASTATAGMIRFTCGR